MNGIVVSEAFWTHRGFRAVGRLSSGLLCHVYSTPAFLLIGLFSPPCQRLFFEACAPLSSSRHSPLTTIDPSNFTPSALFGWKEEISQLPSSD